MTADDLTPFRFDGVDDLIVLVDGQFRADLSRINLPHAVHVESLATAMARGGPVLEEHLDTTGPSDAFGDWNMAGWTDGVFITVAERTTADHPLHVLHLRTPQADTVCFPRVLVHLRDGAQLQVIEHHAGLADASTLTVAVTELIAHPGAILRHDRIQEEWPSALHHHTVRVRADRDAQVHRTDACLGGARSRLTVEGELAGEGAGLDLDGFFLTGGTRRADIWTRIDHIAPHTTSRERIKGVLGDAARGAFTGNVVVRQSAQKTSAQQENRNLLLSREALVDAQPQLEIHTDDVQCSHGSTVGQLDEDALFFLQARGIDAEAARVILTKAFLGEVVGSMHPLLRAGVERRIEDWFTRHPQHIEVRA